LKQWFIHRNTQNLQIDDADHFPKGHILQVTYVDHNEVEYKSVSAIASALEHINLVYASFGWIMRLPIINQVLQIIVDSMMFDTSSSCAPNDQKE